MKPAQQNNIKKNTKQIIIKKKLSIKLSNYIRKKSDSLSYLDHYYEFKTIPENKKQFSANTFVCE